MVKRVQKRVKPTSINHLLQLGFTYSDIAHEIGCSNEALKEGNDGYVTLIYERAAEAILRRQSSNKRATDHYVVSVPVRQKEVFIQFCDALSLKYTKLPPSDP